MDEDALIRRAAADDAEAFGQLVRRHQQGVVRFAARMLGDADAAQDAAQEAFLRLWRGRARYREQGSLRCYLLRIVRNVCLDYARARRPSEPLDARSDYENSPCADIAAQMERHALAEAVRRAVLALPEAQRTVFVLSQYEHLSYREIATVLGCPVGTVASRKGAAVETLRRRLGAWIEEEA